MDDDEIEQEVRNIIIELMIVLHNHGIKEVHMGGLLRLMGVEEEKARESDCDRIVIDEKFNKYIKEQMAVHTAKPKNRTIH